MLIRQRFETILLVRNVNLVDKKPRREPGLVTRALATFARIREELILKRLTTPPGEHSERREQMLRLNHETMAAVGVAAAARGRRLNRTPGSSRQMFGAPSNCRPRSGVRTAGRRLFPVFSRARSNKSNQRQLDTSMREVGVRLRHPWPRWSCAA